jgi:hypothetical protein
MTAPLDYQPHHIGECLWCGTPVPTGRQHGSARKFCCPHHRQAFWKALRRYGLAQLAAGRITIETLMGGQQSVHALSKGMQEPSLAEGPSQ